MALTAQEEALVRLLLEQQAAILSLANNESTITSKLGATKVTLSDLTAATAVADADLYLTRQGVTDKSITSLKIAEYMADKLEETPPQFDNDTSLATTEFVQRALGSFSGFGSAITVNGSLTAEDAGVIRSIEGVGLTIALPNSTTVASGTTFYIRKRVQSAATATITGIDNGAGTFSIAALSSNLYAFIANPSGYAVYELPETMGPALVAAIGYQRLSSGLMLQWGNVVIADVTGTGSFHVNFPIVFPNANAIVTLSDDSSQDSWYHPTFRNTTGFDILITETSAGVSSHNINWMALGY